MQPDLRHSTDILNRIVLHGSWDRMREAEEGFGASPSLPTIYPCDQPQIMHVALHGMRWGGAGAPPGSNEAST